MEFKPFPKIARLSRECVITEKIDGTNASIHIGEDGTFQVGSRTRFITPESDNFGFARWAHENKEELLKLGPGSHYGEWWGKGIQRGYNQIVKRFSLFNVAIWNDATKRPKCCDVVPTLYTGLFDSQQIQSIVNMLDAFGSLAAPGYPYPEGVVIYHTAARQLFKKTIKDDESPKSVVKEA